MTQINFSEAISNIDYEKRPEIFSELPEEKLKNLLEDWFVNQVSGKEIQSKYKVPDRFYSYLVLLTFSLKETCPNCGKNMCGHFLSKSSFSNLFNTGLNNDIVEFEVKDSKCSTCNHTEPMGQCFCNYCMEIKRKKAEMLAEERKKCFALEQKILDDIDVSPYFSSQDNPLSPRKYIELVAWLRVYWSENQTFIESLEKEISSDQKVYYDEDKIYEMMRYLYRHNVIAPSPTSSHEAFSFETNNESLDFKSFSLLKVNWELRVGFDAFSDSKRRLIYPDWKKYFTYNCEKNELLDDEILKEMVFERLTELFSFWRGLLLEDALDYLKYRYKEVNLIAGAGENPGLKTKSLLAELLERFTLGQVYYFIYSGTKEAAAYYQTKKVAKTQAANSAITTIERRAQKAEQYDWNISEYDRPWEMSDYGVSYILYHEILKLPNGSKSTMPSMSYLLQLFDLEKLENEVKK